MSAGVRMPVPTTAVAPAALYGRLVERRAIDCATRNAMFHLLTSHFVGVDDATFERDLGDKTAVILLEDEDGRLRGFSTLLIYTTTAAGRPATIVYSGDTIVARGWWGNPALASTWLDAVGRLTPYGKADVYWLLLTSGFRTYRFLPVFYRSFYPRFDEPTPPETQALLDAIAGGQFGTRYDRQAGIVRFARPQVLRGDLLDVPDRRRLDPHIRFFLERNPGFTAGDELACVTRVHDDNLTAAARRLARRLEALRCR
jgi:hypothetical protein